MSLRDHFRDVRPRNRREAMHLLALLAFALIALWANRLGWLRW